MPDVLAKSGAYVTSAGERKGALLWRLTDTGTEYVRDLLALPEKEPEVEQDVSSLTAMAAKLKDPDVRDYVEEAITCLRVGARRATVVFAWAGAIRCIHERMLAKGVGPLNLALTKHDAKARNVSSVEDFAYIKDSVVLLATVDLKVFDKGERDTMKEALDLRNRCGHPGKYRPGEKKVSSFIEDLAQVAFK